MADFKALARLPQIRERFKRAMNMKVVTDKSGHGFQFRLPGFKYDDFDRAGFLNPVRVMRLLDTNRFNEDISMEPVHSSILYYRLGSFTRYTRTLYDQAALYRPVVYDYRLVRLGNSSLDLLQTLFLDPGDGNGTLYPGDKKDILVSMKVVEVCVDSSTHKPIPIPKSDRETFQRIISKPDVFGERMELPKKELPAVDPEQCFKFGIQPRMSDMDCFFHINQANYMEYCCETAARASTKGCYTGFEGDICFRNLHLVTNFYSKECFPTELLTVSTWEDPKSPGQAVYFVIRKEDGELVFRARFEYHPAK